VKLPAWTDCGESRLKRLAKRLIAGVIGVGLLIGMGGCQTDTPDFPEQGRRPLVKHGMGLLFLLMSAVYYAAFVQGRLS